MRPERTVSEMEEVLKHQAKMLVEGTERSFEAAMEAVSKTDAGRQAHQDTLLLRPFVLGASPVNGASP